MSHASAARPAKREVVYGQQVAYVWAAHSEVKSSARHAAHASLDIDTQLHRLQGVVAAKVLSSGAAPLEEAPEAPPTAECTVNLRVGYAATAELHMLTPARQRAHEFARLSMRRVAAGDGYGVTSAAPGVVPPGFVTPLPGHAVPQLPLADVCGRLHEAHPPGNAFYADDFVLAALDAHNGVMRVPLEVAPGVWASRASLPKLAHEKSWRFHTADPGLGCEARWAHRPPARWSQCTVTRRPDGRRYEFSWRLCRPEEVITGLLRYIITIPFQGASWGLQVAPPPAGQWEGASMSIPDNGGGPEAPLPLQWAAGKRLCPEQLRALRWMQQRELDTEVFSSEFILGVAPPFYIDAALDYPVRGGILAGPISSGKTATVLGLLAAHAPHAFPAPAADPFRLTDAEKAACFDLSTTTLVMAPAAKLSNWAKEVETFLAAAQLKIAVLEDASGLSARTVADLQRCDVVVAAYGLFSCTSYTMRVKEMGRDGPRYLGLAEQTAQFLKPGGVARFREGTWHRASVCVHQASKGLAVWTPEDLCYPVLQQCFWRRVVLDEFHDAEAQDPDAFRALIALGSRARWGITGPPALHSPAAVGRAAAMLGVDLGMGRPDANGKVSAEDGAKAQRFVTECIRRCAAVDAIKVVERTIPVELTAVERMLYLQQQDLVGSVPALDEMERRERLVQLCLHFHTHGVTASWGGAGAHAAEEAQGLVIMLRRRFEEAMRRARRGAYAFELLRRTELPRAPAPAAAFPLDGDEEGPAWFSAAVQGALRAMQGHESQEMQSCFSLLRDLMLVKAPAVADKQLMAALRDPSGGMRTKCLETPGELAARADIAAYAEESMIELTEHYRRHSFIRAAVKAFAADESDEQECPVCMKTKEEGAGSLCILPCGHVFCLECIPQLLGTCSLCRARFGKADVHDAVTQKRDMDTMQAVDFSVVEAVEVQGSKTGSKFNKICEMLKQVKRADPTAKAIVFCQWRALQDMVAHAFRACGFRFWTACCGTPQQRDEAVVNFNTVAPFQGGTAPEILLLNLEASGANCTAASRAADASYIFLVHPFNARDELQAIGRARRLGQAREEIHVYRFVALGTVEEEMAKEREAGLAACITPSS